MPIRYTASLRGRLVLFLTALFAALFGALWLQHAEAQHLARQAALDRALDLARGYSHQYERLLRDQLTMLETLFRLRSVSPDNRVRCNGDLRQVVVSTPSLVNLTVLDSQGRVLCAVHDASPGEAEAWVSRLALERRSPMLGMSGAVGALRPYLALAYPLTDEKGEPFAAILAYLDRDWLNARFADTVPEGVVLRILDGDGVFVVRQPDPACCVGKAGLELGGIGEAIAGDAPVRKSLWLDGVVRLQADLPLKAPLSGVVSVGIPEALALAEADRTNTRLAVLLATMLLALYALSGLVSEHYLLQPLRLLSDGARRLREGDFAWRIADSTCKGEFAGLARDFNDMADTIEANRRELEQDLDRLRLAAQVFEQANEAIAITDAEANILSVNRRFSEITGYAAQEVVGRNPRILQSGRQDATYYHAMWDALLGQGRWGGEIWNRRKDGTVYPEWLSISAVRDGTGRIANYVAVFTDLTLRKAADEALRTSESRLVTLIDAIPDAVLFKDGEGRWLVANDNAKRLFRLEDVPWHGKSDLDLALANPVFSGEHMACWNSDEDAWACGGLVHSLEVVHSPDGDTRIYDVAKVPLFDEAGKRQALVVVGRDVTDSRRSAEELERRVAERTHALQTANRELEAFSYSVSHDLRAPLRAINGFSRLLEEEYAASLDAKARDYLGRVRAGSLKMGELIDDLLELSRVSRHAMKREQADLSALAAEIAAELEAGEPDRRVDWSIAPGIVAHCDIGLMRSALLNLLGNAWKYTSRREHARIEFGLVEQNGRSVYFIRDDGIGFDMRFATKLFGAFQRLHAPSEFPGTGIGLATVARILHRHGGEVWAESAPGQGATFRFTLQK
jgi:PAS domain S-box-containing protein